MSEMYGLGDLLLEFKIKAKYIKEVYIEEKANEHAIAIIRYVTTEKLDKDSFLRLEDEEISLTTKDGKSIFHGVCYTAVAQHEKEYTEIIIYGATKSILLDRKKELKSYQDEAKTLKSITSDFEESNYFSTIDDLTIEETLLQNNQTDFSFIRELSNKYDKLILIDAKDKSNFINIGANKFNKKELKTILKVSSYKDIHNIDKLNKHTQDNLMEYMFEYNIIDVYDLTIGVGYTVDYDTREQMVIKSNIYTKQGYLFNRIYLVSQEGQRPTFEYAVMPQISTGILLGEILEIQDSNVKVKLYNDSDTEVWMPYANTVSNYFYCMPDVGDTVYVYYQQGDTSKNVCLGSIHINPSHDFSNYINKMLTANNRMIKFTHDDDNHSVNIIGNEEAYRGTGNKTMSIILSDEHGIEIHSNSTIEISAKDDIIMLGGKSYKGLTTLETKFKTMTTVGYGIFVAGAGIMSYVPTTKILLTAITTLKSDLSDTLKHEKFLKEELSKLEETLSTAGSATGSSKGDGVLNVTGLEKLEMVVGNSSVSMKNGVINIKSAAFIDLGSGKPTSGTSKEKSNYSYQNMYLDASTLSQDINGSIPVDAEIPAIYQALWCVPTGTLNDERSKLSNTTSNTKGSKPKTTKFATGAGTASSMTVDAYNNSASNDDADTDDKNADDLIKNDGTPEENQEPETTITNDTQKNTENTNKSADSDVKSEYVCKGGDPIDMITGSFLIEQCDLIINDLLRDFAIERKYESVNAKNNSPIGRGWVLSVFSYLDITGDNIVVNMPENRVESFLKTSDGYRNRRNGDKTLLLSEYKEGYTLFDALKKETIYYKKDGQLDYITDFNGNKRVYEYVGTALSYIRFASGQFLKFEFVGDKVSKITDNLDREIKYEYNGDFLLSVTIPNGGVESYGYDTNGYIISITNSKNITFVKNIYDLKGRVTRQNLSTGQEFVIFYDDDNRVNTLITPKTNKDIKYHYNIDKLMVKTVFADNTFIQAKYDQWQNKIYEKDRLGNEIHKTFDEFGHLLSEELPNGLITSYEYNENHSLCKIQDNSGKSFEFFFDTRGNVVKSVGKIDEESEIVIRYEHDTKGRVVKVIDPNGNASYYTYNASFDKPTSYKTAENNVFEYEYDIAGRCISTKNSLGEKELSYDQMDILSKSIDGMGNAVWYVYDKMFNLERVVPPNLVDEKNSLSICNRYYYDEFHNLIKFTDTLGNIYATPRDLDGNIIKEISPNSYDSDENDGEGIKYEYDVYDQKIKIIYPSGGIERIKYDANGNIVKIIQPEQYDEKTDDGKGFIYEYDCVDRLVKITDPDQNVLKKYVYDLRGNILKEINSEGYLYADNDHERIGRLFSYNNMGWIVEKREPIKVKKDEIIYSLTTFVYDNAGNITHEKRYVEEQNQTSYVGDIHTILFTYDKDNRRVKVSDCTGAVIEYTYNGINKMTSQKRKISEGLFDERSYIYDKAGRIIQVISTADEKGCGKDKSTINYEYDKNSNILKITTPTGDEILREYDLADRLISETHKEKFGNINNTTKFEYDKADNLVLITDDNGRQTNLEYDLLNREIRKIEKDGSITRKFYNPNGGLEKIVRPNQYMQDIDDGNGYQYTYDLFGNIITIIAPNGSIIQSNTYDLEGKILSQIDAQNTGADFSYDLAGNRLEIISKGGAKQSFKYDARGNIITSIDGENNETHYILDKWGRITGIKKADESNEYYQYDLAGNIVASTDGEGYTTKYTYTSFSRISSIIDPTGEVESYTYDQENRVNSKTDRNGNIVEYKYNLYDHPVYRKAKNSSLQESYTYTKDGYLESAISNGMMYKYSYDVMGRLASKSASGKTLISYEYDKNGNKIKEIDVTEKITNFSYNSLDLLEKVCHNEIDVASYEYYSNGAIKSLKNGELHQSYEYDLDQNLTSLQVMKGEDLLVKNTYNYDLNGNRTTKNTLNGITNYEYTKVGQLKRVDYPTYSEELFYDKRGNRTKRIKDNVEELYAYDQRNRLTELSKNNQKTNYDYDNAGNLLKDDKATYQYNEFNQTTKVETFDGTGSSMSPNVQINRYDAEGLRYEMLENDKLVQFIFNQNREVIAEQNEEKWTSYIRGSELIARTTDHARTYYHYASDEMGSITHIVDDKNVLNEYQYDAWGEVVSSVEAVENRFKFNGQQLDPITQQYYLRARFYAPSIARFTQEDTYRGDGLNLYAYCDNNPVFYVDPSGYAKFPCDKLLFKLAYAKKPEQELNNALRRNKITKTDDEKKKILDRATNKRKKVEKLKKNLINGNINQSGITYLKNLSKDWKIEYGDLDNLGRTTSVEAIITPNMIRKGTKANSKILPTGFIKGGSDGKNDHGHERGHLLAKLLGGSGSKKENLATIYSYVNNPVMSKFEAQVANAVSNGEIVFYKTTTIFNNDDEIPIEFTIEAIVQKKHLVQVTISNVR